MEYTVLRVDTKLRTISLGSEIEDSMVPELLGAIAEMHTKNKRKPVSLFINSYGGDVSAAIACYDIIKTAPLNINGVVLGNCMSAAVLILQACKERILFPHSRVMIHDGTSSIPRIPARDLKSTAKEDERIGKIYDELIAARAKMPIKKFDDLCRNCTFLTADEAIQHGLADVVLTKVSRR